MVFIFHAMKVINPSLPSHRKKTLLFDLIDGRRQSYDNLMWQMPVVLLTGLSTLLKQSMKSTNGISSRLVSSFLAMGVSLVILHSFVRLKFSEELDSAYIHDYLATSFPKMESPQFGRRLRAERNDLFADQFKSHGSIFSIPFFQRSTYEMWWFIYFSMFWTSICIFVVLSMEKYILKKEVPNRNRCIWYAMVGGIIIAIGCQIFLKWMRQKKKPERKYIVPDLNETIQTQHPLQERLEQAIHACANRRVVYDNLMRQMPSTVFTGLSFLFEVSLNQEQNMNEDDARIATSIIGILISLAVLLAYVRLRYFEIFDSNFIVSKLKIANEPRHEVPFGITLRNKLGCHIKKRLNEEHYFIPSFFCCSSFYLWLYLYVGLICANVSVIISIYFQRDDLFITFITCCIGACAVLNVIQVIMYDIPEYDDLIGR